MSGNDFSRVRTVTLAEPEINALNATAPDPEPAPRGWAHQSINPLPLSLPRPTQALQPRHH
jgi:hypothetical protein